MKQKINLAVLGLLIIGFSPFAEAVNTAPADADTVRLRVSCVENGGATEIPNCFTSMDNVDNWLRTVRLVGPDKPTLVDIGPGAFVGWVCVSSNITLRGAGRDRTIFGIRPNGFGGAITVQVGCTNLSVQDLTIDGRLDLVGDEPKPSRGVDVWNVAAVTSWTNVEIVGPNYGWYEQGLGTCTSNTGKHMFFSSRIRAGTTASGVTRAYTAHCAQSWFWGSEIVVDLKNDSASALALEARGAEVHLYGSNARLSLPTNITAEGLHVAPNGGIVGHYLMAALQGSEIHIHGTGLDVIHNGSGTTQMLYADASSHFHANASGFSIHVSGAGKVERLAGPGAIEAPYMWGQRTSPPVSTKLDGTPTLNGVQTLVSKNGADRYIETDCPVSSYCGDTTVAAQDKTFPHEMIFRAQCTGTASNQGPWFDMTTKACRQ